MNKRSQDILNVLMDEHLNLYFLKQTIIEIVELCVSSILKGNKLLLCGNGGSSADADHIVGEMMKGFILKRPLSSEFINHMDEMYGSVGKDMARILQDAIPAISLNVHQAVISATANDIHPDYIYAQQVVGYGNKDDIFIGISTSGDACNVIYAMQVAKAKNLKTIALTGKDGGHMKNLADISIISPHKETYKIQEDHLSIYHTICAIIESELFNM